jgi:hypothetical protein
MVIALPCALIGIVVGGNISNAHRQGMRQPRFCIGFLDSAIFLESFLGHLMGHYCRICGRMRPNEAFRGRGRATHVCKRCQQLPREQRERIETMDDLLNFLEQSNISHKNIAWLRTLKDHSAPEIQSLAGVILEIALVKPRKRRRWKFLRKEHPTLFEKLRQIMGDDYVYAFEIDLPFGETIEDVEATESPDIPF